MSSPKKSPPKKRSPARKSPGRAAASAGIRWRRLLWQLALVSLVIGLLGLAWLDARVRERFDNHQWQLPARVYARPVELYSGREMTAGNLDQLLSLLRYRPDSAAREPGSYARFDGGVLLHTRGFRDSDGGEPAQQIRLRIDSQRIGRLTDASGKELPVARLEPLQIGSIHPGHSEDRVLVKLEEVPPLLVHMLMATEDRSFHEHHGISIRGLMRAVFANLRAGELEQGGSTLTQQLVKNFWLTRERTLSRKLVEIPMALLLELHYSKAQILETYLNEVYLGQDGSRAIHGMGLGAQFYFGRPLAELEPHQFAMLIGLLKGPSYYDPRRHPERARQRRDTVLQASASQGLLDDKLLSHLRNKPLEVVPKGGSALYAFPHFIDLVRRQLGRDYPPEILASEGLIIHSTLDVLAQLVAEQKLSDFLVPHKELNGAVIITAPDQGDVLALVGDKATRSAGFNRALDAQRPIGSLAKPAVVLAALQQPTKFHLGTRVIDGPFEVRMEDGQVWQPKNFDNQALGAMSLTDALAQSRNQAIARLGLDAGLGEVIRTFQKLGVQTRIPPYPSIFLGSLNLSPFEATVMYQTIATGGQRTPLRSITDVLDRHGQPLARYPVRPEQAFDPQQGYLLQWALRQAMTRGTGRYAVSQLPENLVVAGKTGTSDGQRDAWFAGFSGSHLTLVWLGRDDNGDTGFTGSSGPLRIWTSIMAALPQRSMSLAPPAGIELVWLDADGERRSSKGCEGAREYPLLTVSVPQQASACGKVQSVPGGVKRWFKGLFD
ncbi:MAG: penicillin-binding protein 1B [Alcanivoracaceae bacterium]|jgi:penicillin-binding protein 1B|nr:penicillin-binding protein 1B [Alcanivoracaceae bacterium]